MSLSIGSNSSVNYVNNNQTNTTAAAASTASNSYTMNSDSLSLSSTNPNQPAPTEAGGWKKFSDSVGNFFSNVADSLHFGKTYNLVRDEYNQVDVNRNGGLDRGEFNVATLNLFDFWGTEFAKADKNQNGNVELNEYVKYRKDQLGYIFESREQSGDNHLNTNEIGFIGRQLLQNRDPRLDENQDGMVNKREFTRSALKGIMNIREYLGF